LLEEINTEFENANTKFTFEKGGKDLLDIIFSYPKENYISQLCNLKLKVGNEYKKFLNELIFKTKFLTLAAEHNKNNEIKTMVEGGALEVIPAIRICIRNNNLRGLDILMNSNLMNEYIAILSDKDKMELIKSLLDIACEHAGLSVVDYILRFSKGFTFSHKGTNHLNFKQLIAKAAMGVSCSVSQANLYFLLSSFIQDTKKGCQECGGYRNNVTVITELLESNLSASEFKNKINKYDFHPEEIITARIRYKSDNKVPREDILNILNNIVGEPEYETK
jgi:hypothetical protein